MPIYIECEKELQKIGITVIHKKGMHTRMKLEEILKMVDHTLLAQGSTWDEIKEMTPYPMRWGIFIIVILRIKRFFSLKSILTASG